MQFFLLRIRQLELKEKYSKIHESDTDFGNQTNFQCENWYERGFGADISNENFITYLAITVTADLGSAFLFQTEYSKYLLFSDST